MKNLKSVTNISKLSPTKSVSDTNIDVTEALNETGDLYLQKIKIQFQNSKCISESKMKI